MLCDLLIFYRLKFNNGKKTGVWQFFENGKLTEEVNMSDPKKADALKTK